MQSENLNMDDITDARRKAIAETIKTIGVDELKTLGEGLFPSFDHPWREKYFTFIRENAGSTFHHAMTNDQVHIIYCGAKGVGMWFLPGIGLGLLQPKGLKILHDIVAGK